MFCIARTKGLTVTYNGQRYILSEDIAYNREPTDTCPVQPAAQVQSLSRPEAIIEMSWCGMLSKEFEAWMAAGDYNRNIAGVIETDDE